jgi:hypothetical protein
MTFAPLYVHRPVTNAEAVLDWYRQQGLSQTILADDMHVTLAYSLQPVHWESVPPDLTARTVHNGSRSTQKFGEGGEALVLCFEDAALRDRWSTFKDHGASWNHDSFRPHVTLTYQGKDVATRGLAPYPGPIELGPEAFAALNTEWTAVEKGGPLTADLLDRAVILTMPTIVKARPPDATGRRIVEVEASCEEEDSEGDVILQQGLLDSAASFVATGHLDIDHISEIGYHIGIPDPASYIVGRPLEVKALPGKRTSVVGEIRRSLDGVHNPQRHRYDDLWESLQSEPPVMWYASVFGFPLPGAVVDCSNGACTAGSPKRFIIKAMDWRSLAFTRNPVNTSLKGAAHIITAKSAMAQLVKNFNQSMLSPVGLPPLPTADMNDLWATRACDKCAVHKGPTLLGYREHYRTCKGYTEGAADICAHAMMHRHNMERLFPSNAQTLPSGVGLVPP